MVYGKPVCIWSTPETCQPPRMAAGAPCDSSFLPFPNGSSYTLEVTQRNLVLKYAGLRSAARLKEFCGGEFSSPVMPPALRYCGALVMALENVNELSSEKPPRKRRSRR